MIKKYYLTAGHVIPLKVTDAKGNFININKKDLFVSGNIETDSNYYKEDRRLANLNDRKIFLFASKDGAVRAAKLMAETSTHFAYPIYEVEVSKYDIATHFECRLKLDKKTITLKGKTFNGVEVAWGNTTILNASLKHVDDKYKKVPSSSTLISSKGLSSNGEIRHKLDSLMAHRKKLFNEWEIEKSRKNKWALVPAGLWCASTLGLALKTSLLSTAASFSLFIAFSLATTFTVYELSRRVIIHYIVESIKNPKKPKTSDQKKYTKHLKEVTARIKKLESKATDCKDVIKTFNDLLNKAEDAKFVHGMLSENQPKRNKLQIACWKEKNLLQLARFTHENHRSAFKREIIKKANQKLKVGSRKAKI